MISSKQLAEAIYKIAKDESLKKSEMQKAVLEYIHTYKLESLVPNTIKHLEDRQKKDDLWNTLNIESAILLDSSIVKKIEDKLDIKNPSSVKKEVNESLIGGFRATHGGRIYDASLKNQLHLLKNTLTK